MTFQKCQYEGKIVDIPVRYINKNRYLFLQDVHDYFVGIRRFTLKEEPIPFMENNDTSLIYPQRIPASTQDIIDCHTSTSADEAASPNILDTILKNTEIIKAQNDAIQRQIFEQDEYPIPRTFIVLAEETSSYNPSMWFCHTYRLCFVCDCEKENERHLALHDGYKINEPSEFFRKYGSYLRHILTTMKRVASIGSIVVPQLSSINMGLSNFTALQKKEFCNTITDKLERADEILTKAQESLNISTEATIQEIDGAELRQIQKYLEKVDNYNTLGNLHRSMTSDGHVRWVCVKHRNIPCSNVNIQQLREDFEELGGQITEDVALVQELHENNFENFIELLHQGLTFSTISMKNSTLTKDLFSKFLNVISMKNRIDKLELENISVTNNLITIINMPIRDIISQLNDTVKSDKNLIIEYTFTKPLEKFQSKLFNAIKETNSRLIFNIRSVEVTSSLELAGINEAGFILSIKSDGETDAVNYLSAINSIFKELKISTLHLHNTIRSENLWNSIRQLVFDSQNLEELIMDCPPTSNKIQEWIVPLCQKESLKRLHIMNGPKQANVCEEIFQKLEDKNTLEKFSLASSTYHLQLDFISALSGTSDSMLTRTANCCTNKDSGIIIIKKFLQIIPVHHLSLDFADINYETSLKELSETINQLSSLKIVELQSKTSCAVFHREKRILNKESNVLESEVPRALESELPRVQDKKPSLRKKLKKSLSFLSCVSAKDYRSSQEENSDLPQLSNEREHEREDEIEDEREDERAMSVEPFSHISSNPLYKHIQEIALNFTLKKFQITVSPNVSITHIASSIESNSTVTHLQFVGRIEETDMTTLLKAFRKNTIISHLSLKEVELSLLNLRQIFDMSYVNRTLQVLEIHHCTSDSDRELFQQEIKQSLSENRTLEILFEY
ncbi:unnamed protein product [Adineta steineri]|uniref:Uncharacterized protein n=1 Tax=Adineta steineri TaxID=433720 RepID=A0A819YFJ5_9BILA|nr:unnamed protein product [Adineta steineri]CAF4156700.1 unnamed protein product [Adineta steineri]